MRFRPSRDVSARSRVRRLALSVVVGCGFFAVWAPIASAAGTVNITFNDCTSVTFTYSGYQASPFHSHTAVETLTLHGRQVASKTFTFNTSSAMDTLPFSGGMNGQTLVATATVDGGTPVTASDVLTGCPVTYTGDAYNLRASAKLLGAVVLSPLTINEVGPVSTMSATSPSSTVLSESLPALGLTGAQLVSSVTTGNDVSTANTSVNNLSVLGLPMGAPGIVTSEIQSSSQTTCNTSTNTNSSTGSTNIAYLAIGSTVVVGPGPGAIIPSGPIPKNTTIPLGPIGSVVLNEQTPIPGGLAVNAVDIRLLTDLGLGTVNVIIGHAESDVEGC